LPSGNFLTTIPLESPTLEQKSFYPSVIILTHVDPENLMSRIPLNNSSFASKNALLNAMQISSVFNGSSF